MQKLNCIILQINVLGLVCIANSPCIFKQNQRNHDPYTSELQKACKINCFVIMMDPVFKVMCFKWYMNINKKLTKFQQLQLPRVSTAIPTPTPGVSTPTPTPTPASLLNINSNSNSGGFNSNSNSGVGVGVEPNSNSNSGVDPNPDRYIGILYHPYPLALKLEYSGITRSIP